MKKSIYYDRSRGRYCERWRENGVFHSRLLPEGLDYAAVRKLRKINSKGMLWEEWVKKDLDLYSDVHRNSSVEMLERVHRRITEMFHPTYLSEIDYELILEFRNRRIRQGVSPATVNTDLAIIRAMLYRAKNLGLIAENPASPWHPIKGGRMKKSDLKLPVDEKPVRIISRDDFAKLLAACPTDDWRLLVSLGYYAGLRIGEIMALRPEDIDLEKGIISIYSYADRHWRTKTGKGREVRIFNYLNNALSQANLTGEFVISSISCHGKKIQRSTQRASHRFGIICQVAGLVDSKHISLYTLHHLRKSCITNWKDAGLDLVLVQKMAGHTSLMTTLRHYTAPSSLEEFRERINFIEMAEQAVSDGLPEPQWPIKWNLL